MTITGSDAAADGTAADIYGPYTTATKSCAVDAIALADPAIDYTKYDRVVVLVNNADCGGGGLAATVPLSFQTGEGPRLLTVATLYNAGFGDATSLGKIGNETLHEYGHTLGLQHGGVLYCGSVSVAANGCFANQFVEPIELVSQGALYAHPNSVHKERLGWLEGGRILPIWTSGTYTINAYEDGTENIKVLKIPRKLRAPGAPGSPAIGYYYLSYRRPTPPWDAWLANAPSFANGVAIHLDEAGPGFDTVLLDATPGSASGLSDINDGALLLNQTFTDSLSGISITVNAVTPSNVQVTITIQARTTRFVQAAIYPDTIANVLTSAVGSVAGGGSHLLTQPVNLSAASQPGWGFADWELFTSQQGQQVSLANPYMLTAPDDRILWARFKPAPPPNDNFGTATPVTNLPSQFQLFTAGATYEPGEPFPVNNCGAGTPRGSTIWYTSAPTNNQRITIDAAGSDNAVDIGVYTGAAINMLTPVPNACTVWTAQQSNPHVTFSALAGTIYHVQLDSAGGNTQIIFMPTPDNDSFAAATQLAALPAQVAVTMRGASVEIGEPTQLPCAGTIDISVWYKYTPAVSGSLKVSATYGGTLSSNTAPYTAVYTGSGLGNLVLVPGACNWQPNSGHPDLTVSVTGGTTYWIQIGGFRNRDLDPIVPTTITFQ
jgi:hypothetical protein